MKKIFLLTIIFCSVGITFNAYSQVVYEPLSSSVYGFLDRMDLKGNITIHGEVKPFTRIDIAENLVRLENNKESLTSLESDELEFYKKEFAVEVSKIENKKPAEELSFLRNDVNGRFRVFTFTDSIFTFMADPILGYSVSDIKQNITSHLQNGARAYGYVSDNIGFSLDYRDNTESGTYIDYTKDFTPVSGIVHTSSTVAGVQNLQYDEVNAGITASWSWGSFSFAKEHLNWGSGMNGQIILSSKAPSFPFIRLDVSPVSWFRFTYIHGWLHSEILDSTTLRTTSVPGRNNFLEVPKFIAAHLLTFDLSKKLTVSVGESIIYSDRIEPVYLIPLMFFRVADHYLQDNNSNSGSNAQMFANAYYRIPKLKLQLYSSLFIDELSITGLLKNENSASAVAYTFGAKAADLFFPNSETVLEYTRVNPFVYMNSNDAQHYTSRGYQLGEWTGSNADVVYFSYIQCLERGLSAGFSVQYARKGSPEQPQQQYQIPYPGFLFGNRKDDLEFSFSLKYEIIHGLTGQIGFSHSNINDQELNRTPGWMLGSNNVFSFSAGYGI